MTPCAIGFSRAKGRGAQHHLGMASSSLLPADIAESWRRCAATGLSRESLLASRASGELVSGRLAVAARPVLDRFEQDIAGSELGVVLADRACRVVDYRLGRRGKMKRPAEAIGLEVGAILTEETSGTNAIATAAETGREIFVDGEQHFLTCLHTFSCFGMPILHPTTSQVVGVIDVMAGVGKSTPLMRLALRQLANEIRERLLDLAGLREQILLDAFLKASAIRRRPVVALDGELCLSNESARAILDRHDLTVLGAIANRPELRERRERIELPSGISADIHAYRPAGGRGAIFVFDVTAAPVPRGLNARLGAGEVLRREVERLRGSAAHVVVSGEPGSGRTTIAEEIAGRPAHVVSACSPDLLEAAASDGLTIVEGAEALDGELTRGLARAMASSRGRTILTMTPGAPTDLVQACAERLAVPPLRERRDELATIADAMLRMEGTHARLTLAAVQALRRCAWPGNLRELRTTLRAAVAGRASGYVDVTDLPSAYREPTAPLDTLGPLERAELDAIQNALRRTQGNKVHAAKLLRISRTTLYQRLHVYGLVGD